MDVVEYMHWDWMDAWSWMNGWSRMDEVRWMYGIGWVVGVGWMYGGWVSDVLLQMDALLCRDALLWMDVLGELFLESNALKSLGRGRGRGGFNHFHTHALTPEGSASPVRQTPSQPKAIPVLTAWNPPAPHPAFNPKALPMLPTSQA